MPMRLSNGTLHYCLHEAEPTAAQLAYHAERMADWNGKFPATLDARQLPELPKVYGHFSLDMREEFPGIAERWQPRVPASPAEAAKLIRVEAIGNCQAPIISHGDAYWIDPALTPQEFDLVVVAIPPETQAGFDKCGEKIPLYRETYGERTSPIMCKMLRRSANDWYLATNNGVFPFEGSRVLGVVRRVEPGAGGAPGVSGAALGKDDEPAGVSCTAFPHNVVHSASAAAVTVTQQYTLPVASLQTICSVTFTPPRTCEILCSGELNFTHDMSDPVFEEIGYDVYISGTTKRYNAMSSYDRAGRPDSHSVSRTFSVTGGTPVTVILGCAKVASGTSFVVDHADFRVVELHS